MRVICWRHHMEIFSALLAVCAGNSPVTGEFHARRPVTRSLDVFFHLRLYKRLSKHSQGWLFERPSRPLWRQCNGNGSIKIDCVTTKNDKSHDKPVRILYREYCTILVCMLHRDNFLLQNIVHNQKRFVLRYCVSQWESCRFHYSCIWWASDFNKHLLFNRQ